MIRDGCTPTDVRDELKRTWCHLCGKYDCEKCPIMIQSGLYCNQMGSDFTIVREWLDEPTDSNREEALKACNSIISAVDKEEK